MKSVVPLQETSQTPGAQVAQLNSSAMDDKPFTDPVCGMKTAADPTKSVENAGVTYYFCSQKCTEKFRAHPQDYLQPQAVKAANNATPKNTTYTCPMHSHIQQNGPGTCPICGMALEPMDATAQVDDSELTEMTRRFWVSLALSLPLLFITLSEFIPGLNLHHRIGLNIFNWLQAVLATPVVLWGGWSFFSRGWASFRTWNLNMFSLISLGTGAAFIFSVFALLFPSQLPDAFKMNGMTPLYFEAAAVIVNYCVPQCIRFGNTNFHYGWRGSWSN